VLLMSIGAGIVKAQRYKRRCVGAVWHICLANKYGKQDWE
jgi:hypothetical protein